MTGTAMTGEAMTDVICGSGRLGGRVAALLQGRDRPLLPLRLDPKQGLYNPVGTVPSQIDRLLLCLAPRHPDGGSGWTGLFDGLFAAVQQGRLTIARVVHVSSTAVYECYDRGWVEASTPVRPLSPRSAGLIEAERCVQALASDHCIVRFAGITGPGYERYDPVTMSGQQPRHAVDVRAAAQCIADLALRRDRAARTELVTDGYIYYQQQRFSADRTDPALLALAEQHRLMLPSIVARTAAA